MYKQQQAHTHTLTHTHTHHILYIHTHTTKLLAPSHTQTINVTITPRKNYWRSTFLINFTSTPLPYTPDRRQKGKPCESHVRSEPHVRTEPCESHVRSESHVRTEPRESHIRTEPRESHVNKGMRLILQALVTGSARKLRRTAEEWADTTETSSEEVCLWRSG